MALSWPNIVSFRLRSKFLSTSRSDRDTFFGGIRAIRATTFSICVTVTDEELGKHVEETAKGRNIAPAKLRAEWQRDGRLDNVTYSLRQDKVLKYLVDHAKVTEVEKLTEQGTPLPEGGAPDAHAHAHGEEGHVHGPDCDH